MPWRGTTKRDEALSKGVARETHQEFGTEKVLTGPGM